MLSTIIKITFLKLFSKIFKIDSMEFFYMYIYKNVPPCGILLLMKTLCLGNFLFIVFMSHLYQSNPLSNVKLENKNSI